MMGFPIIILLILLISSVAGFRLMPRKRRRLFSSKRIYAVVGIYAFLGLLAFVFLLISENGDMQKLTSKQEDALFNQESSVLQLLDENKINEIDPAFIKEKKSVTTTESELRLSTMPEEDTIQGFISYIDQPSSNEIEMTVYRVPAILDGYDVTDYLNPVNLDLVGGTLYVTTKQKDLRIIEVYGKLMTVEEGVDRGGFYAINGQQVVHLSVPKHIQLIDVGENFKVLQ